MKLYAHSIILGLILLSTNQIDHQIMAHSRIQQNPQVEEYSIYSAVIKKLYIENVPKDKRFDSLVILARTSLQNRVVQDLNKVTQALQKAGESLANETLEDLKLNNKGSKELGPLLSIEIPYTIVSNEELKNSFGGSNPAEVWNIFYQKYPNSSGLISFSRVGFNLGMDQALVYLERNCGPDCAYGRIIFLTRNKDRWVVRETVMMWVV